MKTLFSYTVNIYLFCACTCILGIPQPRPKNDNVSKPSDGGNIIKICKGVNGDLRKINYLDQDVLLCFGVRVFSHQFRDEAEAGAFFDRVEKKSDAKICKNFLEMKLDSSLEKVNESVVLYNRQFRNENSCERACLDVVDNVNPLCSIILLLSHHFKGNPNGSGAQTHSTTEPDSKADDANEVSNVNQVAEQSMKLIDVPNSIPAEQQPKVSDVGRVTDEKKTEIGTHEKIFKGSKLVLNGGVNESHVQNTQSILPEQSTQGIKSTLPDDKQRGQQQQTGGAVIDFDKDKHKATSQENPIASEKAKGEAATNGIQGGKDHITPNINTNNEVSNKTAISNKVPTTVESTNPVTKTEKQGKSASLTEENVLEPSSVIMHVSSGGNKKEQAPPTGPKLQENFGAGEDDLASKKEGADPGPPKEESGFQVTNVEEGEAIDNSQKSQAAKETENPPLKDIAVQINSKTITEKIPKSNIDEQKTGQKNGKAYTSEDAGDMLQSGRDDTQKTFSEEMHFADDTGDGVAELDTHFSLEAGESNDNTEFTSGGGTGVDYPRPGSDVLETDKNDMDAAVMLHDKYGDDDSHFFAYFMTTMVLCIVGYLVFHNKQKILALALEGRARRGRRRPNTSGYRKLDSNLEEAISSSKSASVTQVIY